LSWRSGAVTERVARKSTSRQALGRGVEAPLLWTFDGPFITCLYDLEDALRRAIVQVGDVSRIAILLELSLPRMHARIQSGESILATVYRRRHACVMSRPTGRWSRCSLPTGVETMSIKGWMLGKVNRVLTRSDLPLRRSPRPIDASSVAAAQEPTLNGHGDGRGTIAASLEHLGAYGALMSAIRDELGQFVTTDLRLHLAIAEHDRYLLPSIHVDDTGDEAA